MEKGGAIWNKLYVMSTLKVTGATERKRIVPLYSSNMFL